MEKNHKIIIIEDDIPWQQIIQEILEKHGDKTFVFSDYDTAEKALRDQLFHFAVVDLRLLTDYHKELDQSDEWGGWKVLKLIQERSLNWTMGTMVLTWHDLKIFKDRALRDFGTLYFMSKRDFDEKEFVKIIEHYFKYSDTSFNESSLRKEKNNPQ